MMKFLKKCYFIILLCFTLIFQAQASIYYFALNNIGRTINLNDTITVNKYDMTALEILGNDLDSFSTELSFSNNSIITEGNHTPVQGGWRYYRTIPLHVEQTGSVTITIKNYTEDNNFIDEMTFTILVIPLSVNPSDDNILYVNKNVDDSAPNYSGEGSSWDNAIPELADALIWARERHNANQNWLENDSLQIWVAQGIYKPLYNAHDTAFTQDGGQDNSFVLIKNVQLYGGFPNIGNPSMGERDWKQNETILSGDFNDDDHEDDFENHIENAHNVIISCLDGQNVNLLDGFVVKGGNASNATHYTRIGALNFIRDKGGGMISVHYNYQQRINNVIFKSNKAKNGGAIYFTGSVADVLKLTNVSIIKNSATEDGGGIYINTHNYEFTNVTITENAAGNKGGGLFNNSSGHPLIHNGIIYGNTANNGGDNIINGREYYKVRFVSSLIEGSGGSQNWDTAFGMDNYNNIDLDPLFTDPENGDYTLQTCSPAINAGSTSFFGGVDANSKDLAGNPRIFDFNNGGIIDMGAYEYQGEQFDLNNVVFENTELIYNGAPQIIEAAGLANGVSVIYSIKDTSDNIVSDAIDAGTYTITASLSACDSVKELRAVLTIKKAPLSITANNDSKTYDGNAYSGGNGISYDGFVNGENSSVLGGTLEFGGTAQGAIHVGEYSIIPEGLTSDNYEINFEEGVLTLSQSEDNIISFHTQTNGETLIRTYGQGQINASAIASSGLAIEYASSNTAVAIIDSVGQVSIIGVGTSEITATQEGNTNYAAADPISFTLEVEKAPLVIIVNNATKAYDGIPYSGGNGISYSGFVYNEDQNVLTGMLLYSGTAQGAVNTGVYSIEANGLSAENYEIDYVNGQLNIVSSGNNVLTFNSQIAGGVLHLTYGAPGLDGSAEASSGLPVDYSSSNISVASVAADGTVNIIGSGTTIITSSQAGNTNFEPADDIEFTINVSKAPLDIIANNQVKEYDGIIYNGGNGVSYNGFVNGEDKSVLNGSIIYSGTAQHAKDVGSYFIEVSGFSSENYAVSYYSGNLTITKAELTVDAPANQAKIYGNADPILLYTVNGFKGDDDENILTGNLGRASGEDVGLYTINLGTLEANNNYDLNFVSSDLSITAAELLITADAQTKVYGSSDPSLAYTTSGFQFTDDESMLTGNLERASGEDVGLYAINLGTLEANNNYDLNFVSSDLNITVAELLITADAQTKVYGSSDPSLTYTTSGFQFTDDESMLTGNLGRASGEDVGLYAINLGTLEANNNYDLNFVSSDLSITAAELLITADAQTKVYGSSDPSLTYTSSGFQFTDDESMLTGNLERISGEDVGLYAISLGNLEANNNYDLNFVSSDLSITAAELLITADAQSKVYGSSDPSLTYTTSGFQFTDDESMLTGNLGRASGEDVGLYAINLGTLEANNNYDLNFVSSDLSITAAELLISADAQTKVYGSSDPSLTYTTSGFQFTDDESMLTGNLGRASGEDVGLYAINLGTLEANNNYDLNFVSSDLNITAAELLIIADAQTKVYGSSDPSLTYTTSGFQFTDDESMLTGNLERASGEDVGLYAINLGTLEANNNYDLNFVSSDLDITAAELLITADAQTKVYGSSDPSLTYTTSGFQFTDGESILTGNLGRASGEDVGLYAINLGNLEANNNYDLNFLSSDLNITAAELLIIADAQTKVYGSSDPSLTYTTSGFQFTDDESMLTGNLGRASGEDVGLYAINLGSLEANNNYDLNFVSSDLNITAAELLITADAQTKVYGSSDPSLTYTASGFQFTDDESMLTGNLERASGEDVGLYAINLGTLEANNNYNLNFVSSDLSITAAELLITADAQTKVYGSSDPSLTYTASGFQFTEDESMLTGNLGRASGEDVGLYAINEGTLEAGDNYNLIFAGSDLEITPAYITGVVFDDVTYIYDGNAKTIEATGIPQGATVVYTHQEHTNAGVYQVAALINLENHFDLELHAVMTIEKADQSIIFESLATRLLEEDPDFQLTALSDSGLDVYFSYDYSSPIPAAVVSSDGWVALHTSGTITITAHQDGNENYHPAAAVSRELRIHSGDASIHAISLNGDLQTNPSDEIYHVLDCDPEETEVLVEIEVETNADVVPAKVFTIYTPKPGIYKEEVTITSENGTIKTYTIIVEKQFPFESIVIQKYNNVLLVNNNPENNGGYKFNKYEWYKNGKLMGKGQVYSAGNKSTDLLDEDAFYSLKMTTIEGEELQTCVGQIEFVETMDLELYPNPVQRGEVLSIVSDQQALSNENTLVKIYTLNGQFIQEFKTGSRQMEIKLPPHINSGVYLAVFEIEGKTHSLKFVVNN